MIQWAIGLCRPRVAEEQISFGALFGVRGGGMGILILLEFAIHYSFKVQLGYKSTFISGSLGRGAGGRAPKIVVGLAL